MFFSQPSSYFILLIFFFYPSPSPHHYGLPILYYFKNDILQTFIIWQTYPSDRTNVPAAGQLFWQTDIYPAAEQLFWHPDDCSSAWIMMISDIYCDCGWPTNLGLLGNLSVVSRGSTVRHPVIAKSCPMSEFGRVTVTTK